MFFLAGPAMPGAPAVPSESLSSVLAAVDAAHHELLQLLRRGTHGDLYNGKTSIFLE